MCMEVLKAVNNINDYIGDSLFDSHQDDYHLLFLEMNTNGYDIVVKCFGIHIWSSEDDDRDYIDEENNILVPLEDHLKAKVRDIIRAINKITFLEID